MLHPDNLDEEREVAPVENLLVSLLEIPAHEGPARLILIDEVLMYAHKKVNLDSKWESELVNFFQYLTQTATKVDTCVIVASLLATDPKKRDKADEELRVDSRLFLSASTRQSCNLSSKRMPQRFCGGAFSPRNRSEISTLFAPMYMLLCEGSPHWVSRLKRTCKPKRSAFWRVIPSIQI